MNDVVLLKATHIGVGVAGREGMHACNSADISIPEFRYLRNFLFVHGRTSHYRNSKLVEYCIFKNSMIAFINLTYSLKSLFTGAILTEPMLLMFFNMLMTFFPIAYYSMTEKEAYDQDLFDSPSALRSSKDRYLPNFWGIAMNIVYGFVCTQIIYWIGFSCFSSGMVFNIGVQADLYVQQTLSMTSICCVAILKVYVDTKMWNIAVLIVLILSFLIYLLSVLAGNWLTIFGVNLLGQLPYILSSPFYMTEVMLCVVGCLSLSFVIDQFKQIWVSSQTTLQGT